MYLENLSITDLYCIAEILEKELNQTITDIRNAESDNRHLGAPKTAEADMEALYTLRSRNTTTLIFVRNELYKRMAPIFLIANKT